MADDGAEDQRSGDKVRIRTGARAGARGVLQVVRAGEGDVQLETGALVTVPLETLTNYSRAARRAWQTMPKRAGRPKLATPRKKMVSIRLDIDVWVALARAAEFGLIVNREQAINSWLRERLDALDERESNVAPTTAVAGTEIARDPTARSKPRHRASPSSGRSAGRRTWQPRSSNLN